MDTRKYNPLLRVTKDEIDAVNQYYNIQDEQRIDESLNAIKEWINKQDHLVEASKYMNKDYMATLFILAKASTEETKKKIDRILTLRALMPELCLNKTPSEFPDLSNVVKFLPLPKLSSKDTTRVIIIQLAPNKLDEFCLMSIVRYCNMISEYRLHFDYSSGERHILDLNHLSIVGKMNPIILKKADVLAEAYGVQMKGIHILNAPPYIDTFVRLLKQTLREKVANRLYIHKSYEEFYEYIPREILPKDYGGDELPIEKLSELWHEHLNTEEAMKLIEESNKIISDESKRTSNQFNEEYLGMPGSFRKLNVD